jgi:hypothetical protein
MSNTIRWMIENVQADTNDIITRLDWRVVCWGPDNSYVDTSGETVLPEAVNPIPYDNLTEDMFWQFIFNANNTTKEQVVLDLEEKLAKAMNPPPITNVLKGGGNLPWLNNDGTGI